MVGMLGIEPSVSSSRTKRDTDSLHSVRKAKLCLHSEKMCPRHESNMNPRFRKPLFYPLNYEDNTLILTRNRNSLFTYLILNEYKLGSFESEPSVVNINILLALTYGYACGAM